MDKSSMLDPDLESTAEHIARLGAQAPLNHRHMTQLRSELIERHVALRMERSRATGRRGFLHRFASIKRAALVSSTATVTAAVCLTLVWSFQVAGHQPTPSAYAQRITQALVHTVPTVTAWQVTLRRDQDNAAQVFHCAGPMSPGGLAVNRDYNLVYLWVGNRWYLVPANQATDPRCPPYWQWVFAVLPARLAHHDVQLRPGIPIAGRPTMRIQYVQKKNSGLTVSWSVSVDQQSGLLLRFQRLTMRGQTVVERVSADYRYLQRKS